MSLNLKTILLYLFCDNVLSKGRLTSLASTTCSTGNWNGIFFFYSTQKQNFLFSQQSKLICLDWFTDFNSSPNFRFNSSVVKYKY